MAVQVGPLIPNVIVSSATSAATNFPAARILSLDPVSQPWRSTSTAQQDIVLYLGSTYDQFLTNPNFATDLSGWTNSDASRITRDVTDVPGGFPASVMIDDASAGTAYNFYQYYQPGADFGGKAFSLDFRAKKNSGGDMSVQVRFLDRQNAVISAGTLTQTFTSGTWTLYTLTGVAPTGSFRAQVLFSSGSSNTGVSRTAGYFFRVGMQAVALIGANFGSVEIATDNNSGMSSPTDLTGSPFSVNLDKWDNAWKLCTVQTAYEGYIRLRIPASLPTRGNVGYYQLGAVVFSDQILTFSSSSPHGGQPLIGARRTPEKALHKITAGGREEVAAAGPLSITDEWSGRFSPSLIDEWRDIGRRGAETPLLVYDNAGNASEVYLMQYLDAIGWTRNNAYLDATLRLRQMT